VRRENQQWNWRELPGRTGLRHNACIADSAAKRRMAALRVFFTEQLLKFDRRAADVSAAGPVSKQRAAPPGVPQDRDFAHPFCPLIHTA
jgi:hypothetical protein